MLDGKVQGWISYLAFSPGARMIAALGMDGAGGDPPSKLFVWDAATRQTLYVKESPSCGYGSSFTISPDGKTIAYIMCGYLSLLKSSTGEEIPTPDGKPVLPEEDGNIFTTVFSPEKKITFSPDGRYLASTSCDGTVRLWGIRQ